MTLADPRRAALLGLLCGLSLGCSDDTAAIDNPNDAGSGGMSSSGSANGGGGSGTAPGGAAGSSTQAGGGAGGSVMGGSGGVAGGMGGMGGMAVDPSGGAPPGVASGRHTARPSGTMPGTTAGYYEYLPPHYGNGAAYPLLVFRHGVGENGNGVSELDKILVHGPPKLIEANEWPETRPFVVLSVQHTGGGCPSAQEMDDFFNFALDNYDIDPKRVYLTGLSCGAIGSWSYMGEHTDELIAAAVPICGDAREAFQNAGCNLNRIPIWAFHGDMDKSVTLDKAQVPITSLQACTDPAPTDLTLTIYPGVEHDSWTMTYKSDQHDIYAWLLSHSKP